MWFFKKGIKVVSETEMRRLKKEFEQNIENLKDDKAVLEKFVKNPELKIFNAITKSGETVWSDTTNFKKDILILILQNSKTPKIFNKKMEMGFVPMSSSPFLSECLGYYGYIDVAEAYLKIIESLEPNKKSQFIDDLFNNVNPDRVEYCLFLMEQAKIYNFQDFVDHKVIVKSYNHVPINDITFCEKVIEAFSEQDVLMSLLKLVEPENFLKMISKENRIEELKKINNMIEGVVSINKGEKSEMIATRIKMVEEKNILTNEISKELKSDEKAIRKRI